MSMSDAFVKADILLPQNRDMQKWAVIACDQYTSQPEYWEKVSKIVDGADSALDLILPEAYLESDDIRQRVDRIHANMEEYLDKGVFREYKNSLIYVERIQSDGKLRAGIVGAVDLEKYEFREGSVSQIRATESTVVERIPPRIKVRKNAPIELPHIMILIDDIRKTVIEPLAQRKDELQKLYDFTLMQGGGSIKGWLLDGKTADDVLEALRKLSGKEEFVKKYGLWNCAPFTFAMGDGNHSLATAKVYYERLKEKNPLEDMSKHPARYALAEIVNLHSPALEFQAIHRIIKRVDPDKLIAEMRKELALSEKGSGQWITIVRGGMRMKLYAHRTTSKLAVGTLQNFLDKYMDKYGGKTDYIHGEDVVEQLSQRSDCVGFLLPDMEKSQLFPTVAQDGALPRKTFSMGHAEDKRYYIEARRIR